MTYQKEKYSQNDPRWKNVKIGDTSLTLGDYGCFITCLAMIRGISPSRMTQVLSEGHALYKAMILGENASKALKIEYGGISYKMTSYPCIMEVHWEEYQHFVIWLGDGSIIDPWDGKKKKLPKKYHPVSWRLFGAK